MSLRDRHAIRQAMEDITQDSKILKTRTGTVLSDQLRKMKLGPDSILGKDGIKKAIEEKDWKLAIMIAMEKEDNVEKEIAKILVEVYKKECKKLNRIEREDEWLGYMRDLFNDVFGEYADEDEIPEDIAQMVTDAADIATDEIMKLENIYKF